MVAGHADLRDDLGTAAVLRQEPSRDVQQDSECATESVPVHVRRDILVMHHECLDLTRSTCARACSYETPSSGWAAALSRT